MKKKFLTIYKKYTHAWPSWHCVPRLPECLSFYILKSGTKLAITVSDLFRIAII